MKDGWGVPLNYRTPHGRKESPSPSHPPCMRHKRRKKPHMECLCAKRNVLWCGVEGHARQMRVCSDRGYDGGPELGYLKKRHESVIKHRPPQEITQDVE